MIFTIDVINQVTTYTEDYLKEKKKKLKMKLSEELVFPSPNFITT